MPDVVAFRPDSRPPARMDAHEKTRLQAAADQAAVVIPGALGRYIAAELAWWAKEGYRLRPTGMVEQMAAQVLAMPRPAPDAA